MADKLIGELPGISSLDANSLFVAEQNGQAVKVSGKQLTDFSNVETAAQVEQAKTSAQAAKAAQTAAESAILKGPIIQNGTWWVYNQTTGAYQDTGIKAAGPQGIPGPTSSVNGITPDSSGNITLTSENVNMPDGRTVKEAFDGMVHVVYQLVNPNLLDNWYFGNPVNQRGMTEQYGGGYFIDRWISSEGKFALTNNGLTLCVDGVISWISQRLDVDVEGQIITVSALTADGKLYVGTGQLTKQSGVRVSLDGGGYVFCSYAAGISMFVFELARYDTTLPITIRAAKLELGSHQTLAHQDADGSWVLNEIPNYGEQLRRCQRYFQVLKSGHGAGLQANGAKCYAPLSLPVPLRTTPTVSIVGSVGVWNNNIFPVTGIIVNQYAGGCEIILDVSTTDAATGTCIVPYANTENIKDNFVCLSADL